MSTRTYPITSPIAVVLITSSSLIGSVYSRSGLVLLIQVSYVGWFENQSVFRRILFADLWRR